MTKDLRHISIPVSKCKRRNKSKSDEELSKDMLSTEENNLLFASSQSKENIGLDELSNDSCYDDEVLSDEK